MKKKENILGEIENKFICKFSKKNHLKQIIDGKFYFSRLSDFKKSDGSENLVSNENEGSILIEKPLNARIKIRGHLQLDHKRESISNGV